MQDQNANKLDLSPREAKPASSRVGTAAVASRMDWYGLLVLFFSSVALSGVVSLYVLWVASINLKTTAADPMERAALTAASDLLKVNIFSREFGGLGIADFTASSDTYSALQEASGGQVRSFNTVAALIRSSLFIAKRYQLPVMAERAEGDLKELHALEIELHKLLIAAIKDDGTGKIYEHVKRVLTSGARGGEHLESLKMKLGTLKNKMLMSNVQAEPEDDPGYCQSGRLKALTPVMVPFSDEPMILHQQAEEISIVSLSDFDEDKNIAAPLPIVILIEAQYASSSGRRGLVTNKVCVVAGADRKNQPLSIAPEEGCLSIAFPQGKPNVFTSLESILLFKDWHGKGNWHETQQGSVPGPGQLAPAAAPALPAMNATDSLSIVLYHWIRQLYSPVSPGRMAALLKAQWAIPNAPREGQQAGAVAADKGAEGDDILMDDTADSLQVNSGLLKDSDARLFALDSQSKPSEAGQKGLTRCFQDLPNKFPSSTLPFVIDAEGKANLPGRKGFDQLLAFDLLTGIYNTNIAAQDSLAEAKLIYASALGSYRNSRETLFLAQADFDSLSNKLKTVSDKKKAEEISKEIDWRNNRINYERNEQKKRLKAISLAQIAIANATMVASQSFECGAKLFQLTRGGINRLDNYVPDASVQNAKVQRAFLLGKRYIFCPVTTSLQENDIFDEAAKSDENTKPESSWLVKKSNILGPVRKMTALPETKLMVEGRSLADLKAETTPAFKADPAIIVFTPRLLANGSKKGPLYFKDYPFKGLAVSESQLLYYCQNGYRADATTANQTMPSTIRWSVLARDLVANRGLNSSRQLLGLPLTVLTTGWCKRALNNTKESAAGVQNESEENAEGCPGLACEWQLRSPLMFLNETEKSILQGTTLTDPESGQRVPQIPPVGPDLM